MSEGMNAVYRFESKITNSTGAANGQTNGNFAFVGLTGGFGGFALGKQNNAAYNHAGAIRDISNWHSYGDTDGSKTANSLSYWYDSESIKLQVAAVMDGGKNADTDGAIDRVEFGLTVGLGDIGKVAIGYEKQEDSMKAGDAITVTPSSLVEGDGKDHSEVIQFNDDGTIKQSFLDQVVWRTKDKRAIVDTKKVENIQHMVGDVSVMPIVVIHNNGDVATSTNIEKHGDKYYTVGTGACIDAGTDEVNACDGLNNDGEKTEEATTNHNVFVSSELVETEKGKDTTKLTYSIEAIEGEDEGVYDTVDHTAMYTPTDTTYGYKASHISASFGLAGITVALGHTTKDSNSPMMNDKEKTNFLGASGSIGDTGLSWNAWGRNVKNNGHKSGDDRSPWTVGLGKSLGGGAHTFIEHYNADDGEDGTTSVALRVDF